MLKEILIFLALHQVSLRSPASFRLTREKGKEVDISLIHQKQRIWIDQDEGGSSSKNADDPSQGTHHSPLPSKFLEMR